MITKQNVFGLMLAATVALAGCASPTATGTPGAMSTPAKQQAAATNSQTTAQAMSEDREAENYGYLADNAEAGAAKYAVQMVGAPKARDGEMVITAHPKEEDEQAAGAEAEAGVAVTTKAGNTDDGKVFKGGAKAEFKGKLKADVKAKLDALKAKIKEKSKHQLEKMKAEKDAVEKAAKGGKWVDNGDGTESKSYEMSVSKTVNGQVSARSVKMVRTRQIEDKTLVVNHYEFSQTANGMTRTVVRDKTLQEDGSYKVTFHSEMTFKDGTKRVADWNKTITADGQVSGTGTITWTGKMTKTVTVTFGGSEEAETAKTTDTATQTETTVTTTADGAATATTTDTATGATTTTTVTADADAAVSTDGSASASTSTSTETSASTAPAASPSPEASTAPEAAASPEASASPAS